MDRKQQPLTPEELMERPVSRHDEAPLGAFVRMLERALSFAVGHGTEAEYREWRQWLDDAPPVMRELLEQVLLSG